jgi:peptide/nickel transport system substrate-binding protein
VEIEALDDYTLQFRLPEPYSPFMDYLTFGILPQHILGDLNPAEIVDAQFNLHPIGSGPFMFDGFLVEDDQIVGVSLVAFEDYYAEPPFIEQVTFKYYPDSEAALSAYQSGEILGIGQVTNDILSPALSEPGLNMHAGQVPALSIVFLNLENQEVPFFQDLDVRRALLMGIDRQRIVQQLYQGQAILAHGPVFPGSWAYFDGLEKIEYDPDAAVQLLRSAGYTIPASGSAVRTNEDGESLSFDLVYPSGEASQQLAQAIADDWERIGVSANLQPVSYEELISSHLEPREFHAALVDIIPRPRSLPFLGSSPNHWRAKLFAVERPSSQRISRRSAR